MSSLAQLESLLRARKLDVTLTTAAPWKRTGGHPENRVATGVPPLDAELGGGVLRGQLSELVGPPSAGRTAVLCGMLATAAARGEVVALIDTCDRFDPASAEAVGLDLSRLLWIRETGDPARALKAMNLVLQAGGFGVVAWDLADVPAPPLRSLPLTTWMRLARIVEGSQTAALLVAASHLARSPGGATILLEVSGGRARETWAGTSNRARLLRGLDLQPRVIGMGRR
jgi:hypothetical protein